MESVQRPNCTALVRQGPRTGLPCSIFAGDGIFHEHCFRHVPKELKTEEEAECPVCLIVKKISWIASCRCKRFFCRECLIAHQDTVQGTTTCPLCREPMNDVKILGTHRAIRVRQLPSEVVRDFTFTTVDGVACSISELPHEDQLAYNGGYYLSMPQTRSTDLAVMKPVFDELRRRRWEKIVKTIPEPTDYLLALEKYEDYIKKENGEDYEQYQIHLSRTKMFPHCITHVYWVARRNNSYIMFGKAGDHFFSLVASRNKKGEWRIGVCGVISIEQDLTNLRERSSYFYNLYRIEAREAFETGFTHYDYREFDPESDDSYDSD